MNAWLFVFSAALVALSACSGPPDVRPPDRPASFAGEISAVEAYDLETGVLAIRVPGPANHVASVRHVAVTPGTLLLMTGSTYPAAFKQFATSAMKSAVPRRAKYACRPAQARNSAG